MLPDKRQNCLFSATMLPEIERLVKNYIGEAERVQIGKLSRAAGTITHRFEQVAASSKERTLEKMLRGIDGRVLVFVKRKTRAEALGRDLKRAGFPADSIHGDKSAESRHVVLKAFERGKVQFMVATDVAARGIDVSDIRLVVNYDMPMALEDYIHRAGRTGRAGGKGEALSLVTRLDKKLMDQIVDHLKRSSEEPADVIVDGKRVSGGGRRGKRRDEDARDDDRRDEPREERGRRNGRRRTRERDDEEVRSDERGSERRGGSKPKSRRGREDREKRPESAGVDVAKKNVRLRRKVRSGSDDVSDVSW